MDNDKVIYYLGLSVIVCLLIYVVMKSLTLQMNIIEGATGGRDTTASDTKTTTSSNGWGNLFGRDKTASDKTASDKTATDKTATDSDTKTTTSSRGWGNFFSSGNKNTSTFTTTSTSTDKDKIADAVKSNTHTIEDNLLISKYRTDYEQTIIDLESNISYALLSSVINNAETISANPTSSASQTKISNINNLKTFRSTLNEAMKFLDSR